MLLPSNKGKLINCNASQQAPTFSPFKENSICSRPHMQRGFRPRILKQINTLFQFLRVNNNTLLPYPQAPNLMSPSNIWSNLIHRHTAWQVCFKKSLRNIVSAASLNTALEVGITALMALGQKRSNISLMMKGTFKEKKIRSRILNAFKTDWRRVQWKMHSEDCQIHNAF